MRGTLNKLFGSGMGGCPCAECEAASFSFEHETFETVVSAWHILLIMYSKLTSLLCTGWRHTVCLKSPMHANVPELIDLRIDYSRKTTSTNGTRVCRTLPIGL